MTTTKEVIAVQCGQVLGFADLLGAPCVRIESFDDGRKLWIDYRRNPGVQSGWIGRVVVKEIDGKLHSIFERIVIVGDKNGKA